MFCFTPDRSQCGSREEIHCTLPPHHHEHCCLCCVCVLAGGITLFCHVFLILRGLGSTLYHLAPSPKKKQRSVHTFSQPSYFQSARNAGAETNCAQLGHDHFTGKCRPEPSQCTAICGDRSNFVPMLPPLFTTSCTAGRRLAGRNYYHFLTIGFSRQFPTTTSAHLHGRLWTHRTVQSHALYCCLMADQTPLDTVETTTTAPSNASSSFIFYRVLWR